jgi:hypothetical protein
MAGDLPCAERCGIYRYIKMDITDASSLLGLTILHVGSEHAGLPRDRLPNASALTIPRRQRHG